MKLFLDSSNFLQTVVAEAKENSETARTLTADLSQAQLNWKPSPEQWSIAQCLEHLAITSGKFDNYFSSALERARKKRPVTNAPAYKPSMVGGWLARQVNPDGGRKLPAPKVFRPSEVSNIHTPLDSNADHRMPVAERKSHARLEVEHNAGHSSSPELAPGLYITSTPIGNPSSLPSIVIASRQPLYQPLRSRFWLFTRSSIG